jgi:hypothetical protein
MLTVTFENGKICNFDTPLKILSSNKILYTDIELIDTLEKNDSDLVLLCYTSGSKVTHWDFFKKRDAFFYSDGFHSKNASCNFSKQDITNFLCSTKNYHVYINNIPTSDEIIKLSDQVFSWLHLITDQPCVQLTVKNSKLYGHKDLEDLQNEQDDFDDQTQLYLNNTFYSKCTDSHKTITRKDNIPPTEHLESNPITDNNQVLQSVSQTSSVTADQETPEYTRYKKLYILNRQEELENLGYSEKQANTLINSELESFGDQSLKKFKKYLGITSKRQYTMNFDVSKVTAKVIYSFLFDHGLDTVTEIWPIISVLFDSSKVFSFKNKNTASVLEELISCSKGINKKICYIQELEKWILCKSNIDHTDITTVLELFNLDGKYDHIVLLKINDNYINTYGVIQNIDASETIDPTAFKDWNTVLLDQISSNKRMFTKEQKTKILKKYNNIFHDTLNIGDIELQLVDTI